ncbi:MAG TPA: flippase [Gemmatimonadaceae bacterium]|nr:flippase [Gemmatimonadaceae bacterium]
MAIAATPIDDVRPKVRAPRIFRDSVLNLLGLGIPLVVALFAIPPLVRGLGTDRFGVLTLAWLVIGYFSLFDLGLGRALTQVVAAQLGETHRDQAPLLVWPALGIMAGLGILGGVVLTAVAPWLVHSVLKIPATLRNETLTAFYILGAAIPVVVVTTGLVGILTAFHRFALLNALRVPLGLFTYLGPLAVLPFSHSLVSVTAVLAVGRVAAAAAYFVACSRLMPSTSVSELWDFREVRPLFRTGAWMTVSNVISPLMVYVDRFFIGAVVSVSAVAYYATPYEMITKLLIIPGAVISVLFPAFASSHRTDPKLLAALLARGAKYVGLAVFPIVLLVTAFAPEGLRWWLGADFATNSALVLQVIAVGVFINAFAQVSFTLVQAVGRPDLSAKFHALELPVYIFALAWAVRTYGILGAAVVWTARVTLDALLLFATAIRLVPDAAALRRRGLIIISVSVLCLALPIAIEGVAWRATLAVAALAVFSTLAWRVLLGAEDKASVRRLAGAFDVGR